MSVWDRLIQWWRSMDRTPVVSSGRRPGLRALCATRRLPHGCALEVMPELPLVRIGAQDLDSGDYLVTVRVPFRHVGDWCDWCPVCRPGPPTP
jgi:hypothetical protein